MLSDYQSPVRGFACNNVNALFAVEEAPSVRAELDNEPACRFHPHADLPYVNAV